MKVDHSAGKFWVEHYVIFLGLLVFLFVDAAKADEHASMLGMEPVEHSAHQHPAQTAVETSVRRSEVRYSLPDVNVTRMDGTAMSLTAALSSGSPVILNFIFTTCTAVCPMLTATFEQFQRELGDEQHSVSMISISIDPEHDTPAKLREYAQKYHAGTQWRFYTGELNNILTVQKAFDVYRGNKMSHIPVMLLRKAPDAPWVRLDGFASAQDLISEYKQLSVQ